MENIIQKYFGDDKIKYFQSSDAYSHIAGDSYLRYEYFKHQRDCIILYIGGNNIDETPLRVCHKPEELENLIKAIIY